ncbi:hypothetical protein DPMN_092652 [Dreissena polymorpha]|uniref:Uncharacterized protein n=1 Tax=Dreissena polymorpha TaxID=45954 RepID=A0A9D4R1X3_DREPO|nr:hypothetical protein DPMN_092652 [Dreissena polymorpha]
MFCLVCKATWAYMFNQPCSQPWALVPGSDAISCSISGAGSYGSERPVVASCSAPMAFSDRATSTRRLWPVVEL